MAKTKTVRQIKDPDGKPIRTQRGFAFEIREATQGDDAWTLTGHAAVFDQPTTIRDAWGEFTEVIKRGAFEKTLQENDVLALYNHETGATLGRKSAGTLDIAEDARGLAFTLRVDPEITEHRDAYLRAKRGDVKGMSFGFAAIKESFDKEEQRRELLEVRLIEISLTPFPAYEMTTVEARALHDAVSDTEEAPSTSAISEAVLDNPPTDTEQPDTHCVAVKDWRMDLSRNKHRMTTV